MFSVSERSAAGRRGFRVFRGDEVSEKGTVCSGPSVATDIVRLRSCIRRLYSVSFVVSGWWGGCYVGKGGLLSPFYCGKY